MLTPADRELALSRMEEACSQELPPCARGIDFSDCNRHTGQQLPIESFELAYLAEKLDCIFDGRIEVRSEPATEALS